MTLAPTWFRREDGMQQSCGVATVWVEKEREKAGVGCSLV